MPIATAQKFPLNLVPENNKTGFQEVFGRELIRHQKKGI